jgi:hypothetical protein
MRTAEPFVSQPRASEIEVAVGRLKRYKSPGVGQIPAQLVQARAEKLRSDIHEFVKLIWNKEEMPHQWKESIVVPIHKRGDKSACGTYRGISLLSASYKILSNRLLSGLTPYADEISEITSVHFDTMDQRLIIFSISGRYWRRMGV